MKRKKDNLRQAFGRLQEFVATPILTRRDEAGVIQAFEFTFELFWKVFQDLAHSQGLEANSPKQALAAAFQLNLIQDQDLWLKILNDRNLTSHTYREEFSKEVCLRIVQEYVVEFNEVLQKL